MVLTWLDYQVNFYCSTGSLEEDELVKSIREGNDSLLDPGYFWRVQNIKEDIVPVTSGDGDGTRGATSNYIFHEDVGCKDTTLGHVRSGYRITDCEDACTASLDCAAFTLNAESSVCLLKATCNSPYKQPNDLTAIKIKKDAPPPSPVPEVDFKYAEGVACTTETLRKLNSVQREQCEDVCRVDFACGAYSYDRTTRGCLLKKSCTADDATPSLAGVSGFKIVSQEQGPGYSILAGAKCTAPQLLSTLLTQSLKTCEDLCSLDARCGVYTHAEGTGRCVLRESCGATASEEGATTGRKPEGAEVPGPVPPSGPVSFNALTSVHCDDPSLAVVRGITDKQCALVCVAAKACKAFTFDPAGDCYLKPSCDDRRPARAFISGTDLSIDPPTPIPTTAPPRTPPPTAPPSSCLDSSDADGNSCVDHLLPPPPEQPSLYGGWEFNSNDDEACAHFTGYGHLPLKFFPRSSLPTPTPPSSHPSSAP